MQSQIRSKTERDRLSAKKRGKLIRMRILDRVFGVRKRLAIKVG